MTAEQVALEQLREWEVGLAKYTELEISRLAAESSEHQPIKSMAQDKGFKQYQRQQQFWSKQLQQAAGPVVLSGDTRFYY